MDHLFWWSGKGYKYKKYVVTNLAFKIFEENYGIESLFLISETRDLMDLVKNYNNDDKFPAFKDGAEE